MAKRRARRNVRCAAQRTRLEEILGFPPATVTELDGSARLALDSYRMEGPLYGGGLYGLVSWVVEAIDGGELASGLEDVEGVLGLVVPDDSVEEGGTGEFENKDRLWFWRGLARARGSHLARGRGGGSSCGSGGEGKAGFGKGREEGGGEPGASLGGRT